MLKIESISKKFVGNDFYSLKDVNMEINKGEIVGLIGRNGAGKSTLMKLMAKSLKPTSGLITYNGIDIHSKDNGINRLWYYDRSSILPRNVRY